MGVPLTALGLRLLERSELQDLLRHVASRRRDRQELSLVTTVIALIQKDLTLFKATVTATLSP